MKTRAGGAKIDPRVITYLNTILFGSLPREKVGRRNEAEFKMLAEALDSLSDGDLAGLGDILMQRFKALELAAQEGSWSIARRLEITGPSELGLASTQERRMAATEELLQLRLQEAQMKVSSKGGKGGSYA